MKKYENGFPSGVVINLRQEPLSREQVQELLGDDVLKNDQSSVEVSRGVYKVVQATNHHIHLYMNGKRIMHLPCDKKMSEVELLEQIDFYEMLLKNGSFA